MHYYKRYWRRNISEEGSEALHLYVSHECRKLLVSEVDTGSISGNSEYNLTIKNHAVVLGQ